MIGLKIIDYSDLQKLWLSYIGLTKCFFILVFIFSTNLNGQNNDSLIIGERKIPDKFQLKFPLTHNHGNGRIIKDFSKEDSLYESFYAIIYYTNKKDTFFQKEYNYYLDKVVAEGKVVPLFYKVKISFFKLRKYHVYQKVGIWKKYDYQKNEIQYLEYYIIKRYNNPYKVVKIEKMIH